VLRRQTIFDLDAFILKASGKCRTAGEHMRDIEQAWVSANCP
jgi:hypothetical protein